MFLFVILSFAVCRITVSKIIVIGTLGAILMLIKIMFLSLCIFKKPLFNYINIVTVCKYWILYTLAT